MLIFSITFQLIFIPNIVLWDTTYFTDVGLVKSTDV
jgi:Na+-transporting NADH:ubiquinone oxidoreductase subunit NqrB